MPEDVGFASYAALAIVTVLAFGSALLLDKARNQRAKVALSGLFIVTALGAMTLGYGIYSVAWQDRVAAWIVGDTATADVTPPTL